MLFTSDAMTAADAHRLGMVNHVVPLDELQPFALALAEKIAERPLFALKLTKEAVNAAQDAQGRVPAMQTSFALHQLCHSHSRRCTACRSTRASRWPRPRTGADPPCAES